jgi:hypothetical protein
MHALARSELAIRDQHAQAAARRRASAGEAREAGAYDMDVVFHGAEYRAARICVRVAEAKISALPESPASLGERGGS